MNPCRPPQAQQLKKERKTPRKNPQKNKTLPKKSKEFISNRQSTTGAQSQ
jgi:hypothetical protein